MKLSEMPLKKRIRQILDYYKLVVVIIAIFIYILCYIGWRYMTRQDFVLYAAAVNVGMDAKTEELFTEFPLSETFHEAFPGASKRSAVSLTENLFLTNDSSGDYHEYVYASRLKILASIEAKKLDLVIGDGEAMEAFAGQGFLMPLDTLFEGNEKITGRLKEGTVILEDNHIEVLLDDKIPYQSVTKKELTALDVTDLNIIEPFREGDRVYLGIIANSDRTDAARVFTESLFQDLP
jgi:hypothetical protein